MLVVPLLTVPISWAMVSQHHRQVSLSGSSYTANSSTATYLKSNCIGRQE